MVDISTIDRPEFIQLADGRDFMILAQLKIEDDNYLFMTPVDDIIDFVFVRQKAEDVLVPVTNKKLLKTLYNMVSETLEPLMQNIDTSKKFSSEEIKKSYRELIKYINENK